MKPTRSGSNWNSASRRSPPPVNNRKETGHPAQPGACDLSVSSRKQTGNERIPAPVEAARLAGKNRAKQAENRQLMQPGLAALVRAWASSQSLQLCSRMILSMANLYLTFIS
jgi:hypothetical protein